MRTRRPRTCTHFGKGWPATSADRLYCPECKAVFYKHSEERVGWLEIPGLDPNQLEVARGVLARVGTMFPALDRLKSELDAVLGVAQNPPPDGMSDGSISEEQYNRLRGTERKLRDLLVGLCFRV